MWFALYIARHGIADKWSCTQHYNRYPTRRVRQYDCCHPYSRRSIWRTVCYVHTISSFGWFMQVADHFDVADGDDWEGYGVETWKKCKRERADFHCSLRALRVTYRWKRWTSIAIRHSHLGSDETASKLPIGCKIYCWRKNWKIVSSNFKALLVTSQMYTYTGCRMMKDPTWRMIFFFSRNKDELI